MTERGDSTNRKQRPAPFEHVFLATDFPRGATRAIARVARLPLAVRGEVTIAHVLSDRLARMARADAQQLSAS
ncbi:MAG: hypothetical protein EHM78_13045 [Myxococcaceae bacterium]|nr:MAG: hypothetical protein EHM78_13045 [Myxococcaceae bacterium]